MTRRPWTEQDNAMAAMALQYAREKFAEEMDE